MPASNHFIGNFTFLNLNQLYRPAMSDDELYQAARQAWRVATWRRAKVRYAAAVHDGSIRAVYAVGRWRLCLVPELLGRWKFDRISRSSGDFGHLIGQSSAPYMPRGARCAVQYNFTGL